MTTDWAFCLPNLYEISFYSGCPLSFSRPLFASCARILSSPSLPSHVALVSPEYTWCIRKPSQQLHWLKLKLLACLFARQNWLYHMTHPYIKLFHKFSNKIHVTYHFFHKFLASLSVSDIRSRSITMSHKAQRFRAIFAWSFLKLHTFFMKYQYFSEWSCDFISCRFNETRCVFYNPEPYTTRFINTVWNENSF